MISVIVVNFNRADLLRACLLSLRGQTFSDLEILVVDNGSTDSSRAEVRQMSEEDARIRLVTLAVNTGFAAGCNYGIREARGELIALLNNDAEADPEWLAMLASAVNRHPQFGMFASKILFFGSTRIDKAGHLIYWDGQNRGRGTGESDRGQYDREEEALFPDGCAGLYRKKLLEEAGGFPESFFAYGDDADLGFRARWLGWRCLYVPTAVVHHHHSSTMGRFSPQKVYWVERNRLWVAARNFPLCLLLLNPFFMLYRWKWNFLAGMMGRGAAGHFRKQSSGWQMTATALRAIWDGIAGLPRCFRVRRENMRRRRITTLDFLRTLWRFRISARDLAFKDQQQAL